MHFPESALSGSTLGGLGCPGMDIKREVEERMLNQPWLDESLRKHPSCALFVSCAEGNSSLRIQSA